MERLCMWPIANSQLLDVTCLITQKLNWWHKQFVCAWIGHVHSVYMTNVKIALIAVIYEFISKGKW